MPCHATAPAAVATGGGCAPGGDRVADARGQLERHADGRRRERRLRADQAQGEGLGAAVRAPDRDRRDGVVRVAGARRPRRRRQARDRRGVLFHLRLRREGASARQGHGDEGAGLRAGGRRRPRRRQAARDRRGRQRRDRCGVQPRRRPAGAQARMAGVDLQRRPVPRGAWPGGRRPRRRRPPRGRGDDDEHVADRIAGLRLRRGGRAVPAGRCSVRPRGRGSTRSRAPATTPTSTASATTATAPTARTSASATSTTTRSWRSSSPSTTTRSTCSTTTAARCSPRRGSPTATTRTSVRAWAGGSSSAG